MNSSVINKINSNNITSSNQEDATSDQESGWTAYLEDFSSSNYDHGSFVSSPSLVSDAAWNGTSYNFSHVKRLNFKNSKGNNSGKKYSCGDDLEDTASSPVNSPKVSSMKQMEVNYPRMDDLATRNFRGNQASLNNFSELGREEQNGKHIIDNRNIDQYADLKKRGLCLVPMSMLMNYIG